MKTTGLYYFILGEITLFLQALKLSPAFPVCLSGLVKIKLLGWDG